MFDLFRLTTQILEHCNKSIILPEFVFEHEESRQMLGDSRGCEKKYRVRKGVNFLLSWSCFVISDDGAGENVNILLELRIVGKDVERVKMIKKKEKKHDALIGVFSHSSLEGPGARAWNDIDRTHRQRVKINRQSKSAERNYVLLFSWVFFLAQKFRTRRLWMGADSGGG